MAVKKEFLNQLKIGDKAIIESINCSGRHLRSHILNMGLTPGTEVRLIKKAPLGDPLEIETRGYELTLRKENAAQIKIRPCTSACAGCPLKETCVAAPRLQPIEHPMFGERSVNKSPRRAPVKINDIKLALVGNQNSGKTTLFNQLTGAHQHVGNFPGVTIDRKDGVLRHHPEAVITDLPGIYSLSPYSPEEKLTRDFILNNKPDAIINIIDAGNIERNLFLTMQLIDLNIPMVIALNMIDEVRNSGGSIDINGLESALGVPVVPISAAKNEGLEELVEHVLNVALYRERPQIIDFCEADDHATGCVHRCIHSIVHLIEKHAKVMDLPKRFAATCVIAGDDLIRKRLNLTPDEWASCRQIVAAMEKERGLDKEAALADMRFGFIEKVCRAYVHKASESPGRRRSRLADKIITGQYTAVPLFLSVMALIFYMTFGPVGSFFSDLIADGLDRISAGVSAMLQAYGLNPVVHSLIIDGIFAGVGSVLSFLPVIVILFFFLSILEDTGYMARVAFVMDKLLRGIGLSGRSFVPMLIGFGCSVPAIMSTRTLPSERDRKMTILLIPFMSCSAKLPIYALFTAAFFQQHRVWVIIGLYLIGILMGVIFALLAKTCLFRGEPVPFVMELPNYRLPTLRNIGLLVLDKAKGFITKAFTVIFWATIIIWFLQTFDARLNVVAASDKSLLAAFGNVLLPIFRPLGITDWRISTAFLTGFMAKESVISTLTVLLGGNVDNLPLLFTPFTAFIFLIFSLLYTPCVAAIATVRRELGPAYALAVVAVQCIIAWLVSFAVYQIGEMFF